MRRSMMAALACVFGVLWATPALALDCTPVGDASRSTIVDFPHYSGGEGVLDVPANVFFRGGDQETIESSWVDASGAPLMLIRDPDLSALFISPYSVWSGIHRPSAPLTPGDTYTFTDCQDPYCTSFTVGEEDTTPPERAGVSELEVRLVVGGHDGSGFSCPDRDFLTMRLSGADDRTEDLDLIILAYIESTEARVESQTIPELAFSLSRSTNVNADGASDPRKMNIELGFSYTRERDGQHFRKGEYCFALALMDRAGNIGERSETRCISTVSLTEPYVDVRDNTGCCAVSPGRDPARPWLLLVLVGILSWARLSSRRRGEAAQPGSTP